MVWLEIIVVLGAIFFGIRQGGIGIGLCGGLGLAILTLGFGLPMGSPPVDVILIIMTVVVAASALQAAYFHERRSLNNFHRDRVITFEQIAE